MEFTMTITIAPALETRPDIELCAALNRLARNLTPSMIRDEKRGSVRDSNGDRVGEWRIS